MTARQPRRDRQDTLAAVGRVVGPVWLGASLVFVLFPLYLLVMVSVAPGAALFGERPAFVVTQPTLRFWRRVVESGELLAPLAKSLSVATLTTAAALVIAAPGAYVIARCPRPVRLTLLLGLLVTRMLPDFTIGVSVARRFAAWGLVDDYVGLTLAHLTGCLPFVAWILVGTFAGIPRDVEESAAIDGASRLATLGRIVGPIAAPGVAVAALFAWLYSWNEFLYARLLTTSQNTLPLQVFEAIDRGSKQEMAAVAAVLVVPILLVVALLQRYLRPGALAGAIKG